jgi:hypothetical protein
MPVAVDGKKLFEADVDPSIDTLLSALVRLDKPGVGKVVVDVVVVVNRLDNTDGSWLPNKLLELLPFDEEHSPVTPRPKLLLVRASEIAPNHFQCVFGYIYYNIQ